MKINREVFRLDCVHASASKPLSNLCDSGVTVCKMCRDNPQLEIENNTKMGIIWYTYVCSCGNSGGQSSSNDGAKNMWNYNNNTE